MWKPLDPRSLGNLMLDEANGRIPITNLALQKLLYFAHGLYLVEAKQPLVSGYFEAWKFGPVHPTAYNAFKVAGDQAINFRAERREVLTGALHPIAPPTDPAIIECVRRIMSTYGRMTPGRLVEVSHARNAPWRFIVDTAKTDMVFGLRIPNGVILNRFKYHKVSVGAEPAIGEPGEDAPFTS
jgi:uncharacterized phage-associated protein